MARGTGRPLAGLILSDEERLFLEAQVRRHRVARSLSDRCRMILRCADGLGNKAVAAEIGVHEHTVGKWRRRFVKDRIEGLSDEPRPGRPRTIEDEKVAQVIERTLTSRPADATHWSLRSMAKEAGLSHTSIWRIWGAFGLRPHRAETFKLSSDPHFVEKVRDIIGLYMSPPDRALVLCVDEKSQIQALDCQRRLKIRPKGGAKDCHLGWWSDLGVRLGVGDAVRGFFGGSGQRSHAELKRSAPAGRPQGGMVYRVGVGLATRALGARCRPGPSDGVPQFSYRHCFCGRGFG